MDLFHSTEYGFLVIVHLMHMVCFELLLMTFFVVFFFNDFVPMTQAQSILL